LGTETHEGNKRRKTRWDRDAKGELLRVCPITLKMVKDIDAAAKKEAGASAQGTRPEEHTKPVYTETLHLEHGPLRVAVNLRKKRTHLIDTRDRGVGCGWKCLQSTGRVIHDKVAFAQLITERHTECAHCFAEYDLPPGWGMDEVQPQAEEEDSDPSESWASDSSQSELDAV
jgi:hypothetical protein